MARWPPLGAKQTRLCARDSTPEYSRLLLRLYVIRKAGADRTYVSEMERASAQRTRDLAVKQMYDGKLPVETTLSPPFAPLTPTRLF
jgi:hypothetical protein